MGDGSIKEKAADLSTRESPFALDIDWLNGGFQERLLNCCDGYRD
jgi:hypothetical protein